MKNLLEIPVKKFFDIACEIGSLGCAYEQAEKTFTMRSVSESRKQLTLGIELQLVPLRPDANPVSLIRSGCEMCAWRPIENFTHHIPIPGTQ